MNRALIQRLYDRQFFGIVPGLETTRALLATLGNPERTLGVIHVAGTNGKGSVSAMVSTGLCEAGLATGLYTSPHLVKLNERFCIQGTPIDDEAMDALLAEVEAAAESVEARTGRRATFFECTTAAAFLWFQRRGVRIAVVETGLGGRLDATNVVTPLLSVITPIALDHQTYLGDTVEAVAAEKAGIVKPGRPVVMAAMDAKAEAVIRQYAHSVNAPLIAVGDTVTVRRASGDWKAQKVNVASVSQEYGTLTTPLSARYQLGNIATAVTVLETLQDTLGLPLPETCVAAALKKVRWPGRFQMVADNPPLLLDGAHNPHGAAALADAVEAVLHRRPPAERRVAIVAGVCADKDAEGFFRAIAPIAGHVWAVPVPNPRGLPPDDTAALARRFRLAAETAPSLRDALPPACAWATEHGTAVIVCGSLFLVGAAFGHFTYHF
ncbi:MAG: bifunctional folylpolyglutamate synthase/dihydrofolate synthase [Kiritimatiellaeota bacterium]|nr:bifunctional folylpolyglutamate synthase/dihydrofolate synthase [Kiritimatiellota bacterium]